MASMRFRSRVSTLVAPVKGRRGREFVGNAGSSSEDAAGLVIGFESSEAPLGGSCIGLGLTGGRNGLPCLPVLLGGRWDVS